MEKGVKQERGGYPLLPMKKDQTNKTNVSRVYEQCPLAWELDPSGSDVSPRLV